VEALVAELIMAVLLILMQVAAAQVVEVVEAQVAQVINSSRVEQVAVLEQLDRVIMAVVEDGGQDQIHLAVAVAALLVLEPADRVLIKMVLVMAVLVDLEQLVHSPVVQ
jgi:hypothetical protein